MCVSSCVDDSPKNVMLKDLPDPSVCKGFEMLSLANCGYKMAKLSFS